jgi:SEC-C motif
MGAGAQRNRPCTCGSGKKSKHCCLGRATGRSAGTRPRMDGREATAPRGSDAAPSVLREQGTLAGKRVFVHPGRGDRHPGDLREHLKRFPTRSTLSQLGSISFSLDHPPPHLAESVAGYAPFKGTIVMTHSLPYLALLSIESSSDHDGRPMDDRDFEDACNIFLNLKHPAVGRLASNERGAVEYLLRNAQSFAFQAEQRHRLPRVVMLLKEIWPTVVKAQNVRPIDDLVQITGLDLDRLLFLGWAAYSASQKGWFRPYAPESSKVAPLFSAEAQQVFLTWASADYDTIRSNASTYAHDLPDDTFDQYRFNPLAVHPIVRPDVQPDPAAPPVYLVPSHRLLFERVHRGLYHVLADHHRGKSEHENPFRSAFGLVFQEYVGQLLESAIGQPRVLPERSYRSANGDVDSVDWFVVENDHGVLVEVKQSSLSLPTRTLGDIEHARADVKKSLAKAIRQIMRTSVDVQAGSRGLEDLAHVRSWEHLIVTYDQVPWANSFLRDLARQEVGPNAPHVHVAAIEEFEYLLGGCRRDTLSNILRRKRVGPDRADGMDFKDWMARDADMHENPALSKKYHELFESWGVRNDPTG